MKIERDNNLFLFTLDEQDLSILLFSGQIVMDSRSYEMPSFIIQTKGQIDTDKLNELVKKRPESRVQGELEVQNITEKEEVH